MPSGVVYTFLLGERSTSLFPIVPEPYIPLDLSVRKGTGVSGVGPGRLAWVASGVGSVHLAAGDVVRCVDCAEENEPEEDVKTDEDCVTEAGEGHCGFFLLGL